MKAIFVVLRAATYASIFVGLFLVFVPARLISWSGITRPAPLGAVEILGAILVVGGAALALWCVLTFALVGRGTPAPFDPPRSLVTRGPYHFVRNPMVIGAGLALAGVALFYRSLPVLGYTLSFLLVMHLFILRYEEPKLDRMFGAEYEAYRRRVRRWWPQLLPLLVLSVLWPGGAMGARRLAAQEHPYVPPLDSLVRETLDEWQDLKFGLLMHWGLYAQLGIVESWALVSEDQPFQDRGGMPYTEFKDMYFGLIREFDPRHFDPAPWAAAARDAGMRYVVFTTKHHDGFSMWDTRQTDFRITGPDSPFRDHPRANVAKEVFAAFRAEGFMIGAYFSKPDWHHPDYWSPLWATPNRNNNYDVRKYPEKWQNFRDFTYAQVEELMTTLGRVDILWLDGGWVRPDSTINEEVRSWGFDIAPWEQDIDMPRIAAMARRHQPGLLIVDRTVHGEFEDYRTPEQRVPDEALPYPWETNMTLTQSWGHNFDPIYKTPQHIVHTLIDVASKGGNYLLNVAPTPDGTFEEEAYDILAEIGRWMKVNGESIYGTRSREPFGEGDGVRFTRSKDGRTVYAFLLEWPGETVELRTVRVRDGGEVRLLGYAGALEWSRDGEGMHVRLPPGWEEAGAHAWVLRVDAAE